MICSPEFPLHSSPTKLGVDQLTATNAVKAALPTLLGGSPANATEPAGALIGALDQHGRTRRRRGRGGCQVDIASGSKIVDKAYGAKQNAVISALGATAGTVGNDLVAKLLPMLAPIVMAHPAEQLTRGGDGMAAPRTQSGGGIGDMLGGLLGGSSNSGGIGGTIGEALAENAGGALESMLDGLFWRKR
ncbi:DUF937 domain-containing protein [Nocardia sp. NPDC004278]